MFLLSDAFLLVSKRVVLGRSIEVLIQFILLCWTLPFLAFSSLSVNTHEANVYDLFLAMLYRMGRLLIGDLRISAKSKEVVPFFIVKGTSSCRTAREALTHRQI